MENQERESFSPKPTTPRPTDPNPFPTTFVQADTSSFKQVVQMLTGSAETAAAAVNPNPYSANSRTPNPIPPKANGPKKPAFKLYERRNSLKNLGTISPLSSFQHHPTVFSPRKQQQQQQPEVLSPSILDFPSLVLSPVTPLISDPFIRAAMAAAAAAEEEEEERAIAEKGFYLHPSPRGSSNKDGEPPRLLPLFPVSSPRASSSE